MKKKYNVKRMTCLVAACIATSSTFLEPAYGVGAGATPSYSGFSMSMLIQPTITPFRDTTQDLDALLVDNSLASKTTLTDNSAALQAVTIPYAVDITGSSSAVQIKADTLVLQALATNMGLSDYSAITAQATIDYAVTTDSSSSTSSLLWGTAAANQTTSTTGLTQSGNNLTISKGGLPEFNVQSIVNPVTYLASNAQKYLALISGSAAPVGSMLLPTDFTGSNSVQNYANYNLMVAREAAVQSAGVAALQEFAADNVPLTNTPAASLGTHFVNTGLIPTQNTITHFMATRRMDPANGWYYRIQQASPIELQRESLYLQAESLYELEKVRQQTQKDNLLLSLLLIEQSRVTVGMANMQAKMSAASSATSTSSSSSTSTPATTTTVPMDTTTTTTTS